MTLPKPNRTKIAQRPWAASVRMVLFILTSGLLFASAAVRAADDGVPVDRAKYADRALADDITAAACPDNPRDLGPGSRCTVASC